VNRNVLVEINGNLVLKKKLWGDYIIDLLPEACRAVSDKKRNFYGPFKRERAYRFLNKMSPDSYTKGFITSYTPIWCTTIINYIFDNKHTAYRDNK